MVLVPQDNLSAHQLFGGISWLVVDVEPLQLIEVRLHDLWPSLAIVEVDSIDTVFRRILNDLINEQVPGLDLPVVEHGRICELLRLSIGAVADVSLAIFV